VFDPFTVELDFIVPMIRDIGGAMAHGGGNQREGDTLEIVLERIRRYGCPLLSMGMKSSQKLRRT